MKNNKNGKYYLFIAILFYKEEGRYYSFSNTTELYFLNIGQQEAITTMVHVPMPPAEGGETPSWPVFPPVLPVQSFSAGDGTSSLSSVSCDPLNLVLLRKGGGCSPPTWPREGRGGRTEQCRGSCSTPFLVGWSVPTLPWLRIGSGAIPHSPAFPNPAPEQNNRHLWKHSLPSYYVPGR